MRAGGPSALSCRHATEQPAFANARSSGWSLLAGPLRGHVMSDLFYIGLTVAFFVLAAAFAWFCEKVR
jgi:hypothetical protein